MLYKIPFELWYIILDNLNHEIYKNNLLMVLLCIGKRENIDMIPFIKTYIYKKFNSIKIMRISLKLFNELKSLGFKRDNIEWVYDNSNPKMTITIKKYMSYYSKMFNEKSNNRLEYDMYIKYIFYLYNNIPEECVSYRKIFYNIFLNRIFISYKTEEEENRFQKSLYMDKKNIAMIKYII